MWRCLYCLAASRPRTVSSGCRGACWRFVTSPSSGGSMRGNGSRLLVVLLAILAPLLLQPTPALALTFTVNSTVDEPDATSGDGVCASAPSGACTLRAAIMEANFLGGSHAITLPAGNYVLTRAPSGTNDASTGDLNVGASLAITGAGAAN